MGAGDRRKNKHKESWLEKIEGMFNPFGGLGKLSGGGRRGGKACGELGGGKLSGGGGGELGGSSGKTSKLGQKGKISSTFMYLIIAAIGIAGIGLVYKMVTDSKRTPAPPTIAQ